MQIRHGKRTWIAAAAAVAVVGFGGTGVVLAAEPNAVPSGPGQPGARPVSEQAGLLPEQPARNCIDDVADRVDDRRDTGDDADDRCDDDPAGADDRFDDDRNGADDGIHDDGIDDRDGGIETDGRAGMDDGADDGQDD